MARDAKTVRGTGPVVFTSLVVDPAAHEIADWLRTSRAAWAQR